MTAPTRPTVARPWRVAVTRDEDADGPLTLALGRHGFAALACPVMATAPGLPPALVAAAGRLHTYDWLICASVRAVDALAAARSGRWPDTLRTAAVGARTAAAMVAAGATAPLMGDGDGADALWERLRTADAWKGRRVLVPTTPGGRRLLIDALAAEGAAVDAVDAYRMEARPTSEVAAAWTRAAADAVVLASPRAASLLMDAIGVAALRRVVVVAIGPTTAAAIEDVRVPCLVPPVADFSAAAATLARHRDQQQVAG